jgi:AAA+ ATPase superfamily predicted ATPase
VYNNARLEGRAEYVLVDDFGKESAFSVYEEFGFENKELIWKYIGGKLGDMIRLFEKKKQGYTEQEALQRLLEDTMGRIRDFLEAVEEGEKEEISIEDVKEALMKVSEKEVLSREIRRKVRHFLVEENLLFYNPMKGIVRFQSELIHKAVIGLLK